jgi:hypothetical protein
MIKATIDPHTRWLAYVDSLAWSPGQLDQSSWNAFLRAGSLSIPFDEALAQVEHRIVECGGTLRVAKVERQLRRAYQIAAADATITLAERRANWTGPKPTRAEFDPARAEAIARRIEPVTEEWLAGHSPIDVRALRPHQFLEQLYRPGEYVLIFNRYQSQGQRIWRNGQKLTGFERACPHGVWFLSNPVNSQWAYLERCKSKFNPEGKTRRSEENITDWRYAVLECDQKPALRWLPIWLAIVVQLPVPIVSITTSGGKSVHVLLKVAASSKTEWDQIVRVRLLPRLVPLGADPNAMTAVRLTRLPGCQRGSALQRLLYLNPAADGRDFSTLTPQKFHG